MITILDQTFPTKKALKERIRAIVTAHPNHTPLPADVGAFLNALLERHPCPVQKRGVGIAHWLIVPTSYNNRCLWITRTDGSQTDISWQKCVDSEVSPFKDLCAAARIAVAEQVKAFKVKAFAKGSLVCPFSGEALTLENSHVDHFEPTFVKMVEIFFGDRMPALTATRDGATEANRIAETKLEARWQEYHALVAQLRIVSKQTNLSTLRRS